MTPWCHRQTASDMAMRYGRNRTLELSTKHGQQHMATDRRPRGQLSTDLARNASLLHAEPRHRHSRAQHSRHMHYGSGTPCFGVPCGCLDTPQKDVWLACGTRRRYNESNPDNAGQQRYVSDLLRQTTQIVSAYVARPLVTCTDGLRAIHVTTTRFVGLDLYRVYPARPKPLEYRAKGMHRGSLRKHRTEHCLGGRHGRSADQADACSRLCEKRR